MRLAFLVPVIATLDNGTYRVNANYGRLIDSLAEHFGVIDVLASIPTLNDETYYPGGRSLYRNSIAAPNVHIAPVPMSLSTDRPLKKAAVWLRRLPHYWRAIRLADVAYIVMPGFSSLMAYALCRLLRKPYILYYGSDWVGHVPFMTRWGSDRSASRAIYQRLARWAEVLPVRRSLFTLATGPRLREHLSRFGPGVFETRPMLAIGPADFFERQDTRGDKAVEVLYVGALLPRKGVHFLIEAMAELQRRRLSVHLTLAGAAEVAYASHLRHEVAAKNLDATVTFAGFVSEVDELLRLYREADLLVLPTLSEGFPRVVYEAMSQSLPVVATSIPAIAAAVEDGRQALLVRPGSSDALADAIERIATQPDLRRRLIANGFAFASARLTGTSTGQQIIDLLEQFPVAAAGSAGLRRWARTYYSQSDEYRDRLTSKWSNSWAANFREYIGALSAVAPPGGRILDLGCGGGQTTSALSAAGFRAVGADLFLGALKEFPPEMRSRGLSLVNCDAAELPFRSESFGSAGSYTMLEHVPDAETVLGELDRVLEPGQSLVICGPNMLSPFHIARLWWKSKRTGRRHPDGTVSGVLLRVWLSITKALSRQPRFLYRRPMTQGLEFAGSDYDAICLVNPFDVIYWLRARGYQARNRPTGASRAGRLLARTMPNLSGGLCIVARKPGSRP